MRRQSRKQVGKAHWQDSVFSISSSAKNRISWRIDLDVEFVFANRVRSKKAYAAVSTAALKDGV